IIFGLLPAIELSRQDIETGLREGGRSHSGGVRRRRFLSGLIVLESALSVILLIGAGLMLRSFARMMDEQPGFRPEQVLAAEAPSPWEPNFANVPEIRAAKTKYFRDVVQRLEALPGVTSAALVTGLPMGTVNAQTLIRLEGRTPEAGEDLRVGYSSVSPQY